MTLFTFYVYRINENKKLLLYICTLPIKSKIKLEWNEKKEHKQTDKISI